MDLAAFAQWVHDTALSDWLRHSLKAMPIIEAIHVMAAATVFGTILVVDLRLLGWPGVQRSFSKLHHELVHWTWFAFAAAVGTGVLLFVVNSVTYYGNTAFRLKMLALLFAGVNMFIFERVTSRTVAVWDKGPTPSSAKMAGALSLTIWLSVLFIARWIGFTKGYDFSIPENVDIQLNFGQ